MRARQSLAVLLLAAACSDAPIAGPTDSKRQLCGNQPITLAVGEVGVPTHAGDTQCLLSGDPDAEYVIAWLDTRSLTAARTGVEPAFESYPIGITIAPGSTIRAPEGALRTAAAPTGTESAPHGTLGVRRLAHSGVIAP